MIQAPNCSNQRDEDMKLSLSHETRDTRHERDTRETPSKQASKEQQEPTRTNRWRNKEQHLPQPTTPSLTRASSWSSSSFLNHIFSWSWYWYWYWYWVVQHGAISVIHSSRPLVL